LYNSRPRTYRGGFAVPENYSGNAFDEASPLVDSIIDEKKVEKGAAKEESAAEFKGERQEIEEAVETSAFAQKRSGIGFDVGRLFRGGIGFEELLILALILLISQNNSNNDDVIVLLALLLFIS
jgi:hypothetical protein